MSNFYRVACGDNAVWFDNERDATQYFRDRANVTMTKTDCLGSTDSIAYAELVGKLNELGERKPEEGF